jgi:Na+/H+ antiporter NhaD/arsenite permease-like protein
MGMMLALGVVKETGAFDVLANLLNTNIRNVWIIGLISGLISTFLDNFALAMNMFSIYDVQSQSNIYWKVIAYSTAIGGNVLTIGSMSGLALATMERMHVGWFFRNVGYKAAVGFILGLCAMYFIG